MAAQIPGGKLVGINLETLRFIVNGAAVMAADIAAGTILLDVPGATNRLWSFTLNPAKRYQEETVVASVSGVTTYTHAPFTGVQDVSPNYRRNEFSGQFDICNMYELPDAPPPPPAP